MKYSFSEAKELVIGECNIALGRIDESQVNEFIKVIQGSDQVFFVGVGRVFLSLQAMCKRFAHLGIKAHCVGEIIEPAITENDLLVVGSGSGESLIPTVIAKKAKKLGAKIAWIGSNDKSTIANLADVKVRIPVQTKLNREDELQSKQPLTSLFEQCLLIYGDTVVKMITEDKNLDLQSLWKHHANLE